MSVEELQQAYHAVVLVRMGHSKLFLLKKTGVSIHTNVFFVNVLAELWGRG